jgi:hypothetical protein
MLTEIQAGLFSKDATDAYIDAHVARYADARLQRPFPAPTARSGAKGNTHTLRESGLRIMYAVRGQ